MIITNNSTGLTLLTLVKFILFIEILIWDNLSLNNLTGFIPWVLSLFKVSRNRYIVYLK